MSSQFTPLRAYATPPDGGVFRTSGATPFVIHAVECMNMQLVIEGSESGTCRQ